MQCRLAPHRHLNRDWAADACHGPTIANVCSPTCGFCVPKSSSLRPSCHVRPVRRRFRRRRATWIHTGAVRSVVPALGMLGSMPRCAVTSARTALTSRATIRMSSDRDSTCSSSTSSDCRSKPTCCSRYGRSRPPAAPLPGAAANPAASRSSVEINHGASRRPTAGPRRAVGKRPSTRAWRITDAETPARCAALSIVIQVMWLTVHQTGTRRPEVRIQAGAIPAPERGQDPAEQGVTWPLTLLGSSDPSGLGLVLGSAGRALCPCHMMAWGCCHPCCPGAADL